MKAFRSMRNKLIPGDGARRYLLYAVGEIALVVAGILIALAINNWNEDRKDRETLDSILTIIQEDLQRDIEEIDKFTEHYANIEDIFVKLIDGKATKEEINNDRTIATIGLGYRDITINQRGLNLLRFFKSQNRLDNSTIVASVDEFYTERLAAIEVDDKLRAENFNDNFSYWKNNYPWWSDYLLSRNLDGFIDYALTDPDFKNRLTTTYIASAKVFVPELHAFKEQALQVQKDIDTWKSENN